jgi:hypothetical protein
MPVLAERRSLGAEPTGTPLASLGMSCRSDGSHFLGTGRRASLLGGLLRLAALSAEVAEMLTATGLDRQFHVCPSVDAAISSPRPW